MLAARAWPKTPTINAAAIRTCAHERLIIVLLRMVGHLEIGSSDDWVFRRPSISITGVLMMFTYSLCVDADRFPATALRQLAITHPISARLREPTLLRSAQHSPTSQSETLPSASLVLLC